MKEVAPSVSLVGEDTIQREKRFFVHSDFQPEVTHTIIFGWWSNDRHVPEGWTNSLHIDYVKLREGTMPQLRLYSNGWGNINAYGHDFFEALAELGNEVKEGYSRFFWPPVDVLLAFLREHGFREMIRK